MNTKSVSVLTMYAKCMKNLQQQQQKRTVRQCKPCVKAGADLFLCLFVFWLELSDRWRNHCSWNPFFRDFLFLFFVVVVLIVQCLGHLSSDIHDWLLFCVFFWFFFFFFEGGGGGGGGYFIFKVVKPQGQAVLRKLTFSKYVSHQLERRELIRAWRSVF